MTASSVVPFLSRTETPRAVFFSQPTELSGQRIILHVLFNIEIRLLFHCHWAIFQNTPTEPASGEETAPGFSSVYSPSS